MATTIRTYTFQGETYDCEYKIRDVFAKQLKTALPKNLRTAEDWKRFDVDYVETTVADPKPTDEQLNQMRINTIKAESHDKIENLTITVDDMEFQCSPQSLSNIANAVSGMIAGGRDKTQWVLKDNTIADVTVQQLNNVLDLAEQQVTQLRIAPYI